MKYLSRLNLSKRFLLVLAVAVITTVFSAQVYYSSQERVYLELRLKEKAAFLHKFYSFLISDLLVRNDDVTLISVINGLELDPEVTAVTVVDRKGEVRYNADPQKMGTVMDDPLIKTALQSGEDVETPFMNSGGRAYAMVSTLRQPGVVKPLGVVRIDLTYHRMEQQLTYSRERFWYIILGSLTLWSGLFLYFLKLWILSPIETIRRSTSSVNATLPEPNLPETTDDFGPLHTAINDLVLRFKNEWHQQWATQQNRAEQEKAWIQQLVNGLLPQSRVIVADKDNRVLSDSGNGDSGSMAKHHLMDLIKDSNFATLLTTAFQKEGEVARGPVNFQGKTYEASILSVPLQQSIVVKTLIALQSNL